MKLWMSNRIIATLGWAAILAPSLVLRVYPAVPLAADEKVFAVVARQIAAGAVLYRDVFDHKGPALYWAFNVWTELFGGSFVGVRVGSVLASVALQLAVFLVVRLLTERQGTALFAAFAIGLAAWVTNRIFGVELWIAASAAVGLALLVCSRGALAAFVAGAAVGFGVMIRPTALVDALAVGLVAAGIAQGHRPKRVIAYCAGLAVCCAAFFWPIVRAGAGADAIYALFTFNSYYSSVVPLDGVLVVTLGRWLAVQLVVCAFLWVPTLGTLLRLPEDAEQRRWVRLLLFWTVLGIASSLLGRRPFNHYLLQPYLPMSILAGLWLASLRVPLPSLTPRAVVAVSCGWLTISSGLAWVHVNKIRAPQLAYAEAERQVAERVDRVTSRGDRVYVWGNATNIYFFSERAPATRYLYYPPFRGAEVPPPFEAAYWRDWLARFDDARPAVVVDCSGSRWNDLPWLDPERNHAFAERLHSQYEPIATLQGFRIYALRDRRNAELR